jgi:hypothetical protein
MKAELQGIGNTGGKIDLALLSHVMTITSMGYWTSYTN